MSVMYVKIISINNKMIWTVNNKLHVYAGPNCAYAKCSCSYCTFTGNRLAAHGTVYLFGYKTLFFIPRMPHNI